MNKVCSLCFLGTVKAGLPQVFSEREKPEFPGKNPSEQTQATYNHD